jgi:hypothetical protein
MLPDKSVFEHFFQNTPGQYQDKWEIARESREFNLSPPALAVIESDRIYTPPPA